MRKKNTFCKFWFQHLAVLQTVLRGGTKRSVLVASYVCAQLNGVRNVAPNVSVEIRSVASTCGVRVKQLFEQKLTSEGACTHADTHNK
jgi:hypothetical protein